MDTTNQSKRWRKKKPRKINYTPLSKNYTPQYVKQLEKEWVVLYHDELEALRLKNLNKLWIITAAKQMWIWKSTFANTHNKAVEKVADAIVNSKSLYIITDPEFGEPII